MARALIVLCSIFIFQAAFSQRSPGGGRLADAGNMTGAIYGKIVDSITGKGINAVSLQIAETKWDSTTKKKNPKVIAGALTSQNGEFRIENLPVMGQYQIQISAIGFDGVNKMFSFVKLNEVRSQKNKDINSLLNKLDVDLGNIALQVSQGLLSEVKVAGTAKPLVQLAIDRKVYNVEKDISAAGGTAIDVVKNVPSVMVDIDGNVSLRNSRPQIYIDGIASILSLDQIPSDQIQSIEVITNPSAKFDASGGTSGILNIVLKKNKKPGYNGTIRAGIDQRGKGNGAFILNIKNKWLNYFINLDYSERLSKGTGISERTTTGLSPNSYLKQTDIETQFSTRSMPRMGIDFYLSNRTTLSFGANLFYSKRSPYTESEIINRVYNPGGDTATRYQSRIADNYRYFKGKKFSLDLVHNFPEDGKQLTSNLSYFYAPNFTSNFLQTNTSNGGGFGYFQKQNGDGNTNSLTAQIDYVDPLNDGEKIETGIKFSTRTVENENEISLSNTKNGAYEIAYPISNFFRYEDKIFAAYGIYTGRLSPKTGYQIGLRAESSVYNGALSKYQKNNGSGYELVTENYTNKFPASFFPSMFLTHELNTSQQLQLNYTRKINRPSFMQLFPFINYSDSLILEMGNPDLKPEFTNTIELSYQKTYQKSNTFIISAYYKHSSGLLTNYQKLIIDTYTGKEVLVNTYINASNAFVSGVEFINKHKLYSWWDITANLNLYTSKINSADKTITTADQLYSWFGKFNSNFKLPASLSLQVSGNYMSKTVLSPGGSGAGSDGRMGWGPVSDGNSQGYSRPKYSIDASVKYDFLKSKKASVSLSVSDMFKTDRKEVFINAAVAQQHTSKVKDQRFFRLNFSYSFGKVDGSIFKRKNTKADQGGMDM